MKRGRKSTSHFVDGKAAERERMDALFIEVEEQLKQGTGKGSENEAQPGPTSTSKQGEGGATCKNRLGNGGG
jgi:hypothetical protein